MTSGGPKTAELIALLESAVTLLRSCDDKQWVSWLEKDTARLRASDFEGIEHFLQAFGGMGSINDLVLHPLNGHRLTEQETTQANERLRALLSRAWELARQIRSVAIIS